MSVCSPCAQDGSCDTAHDDWKQVAMEEFDNAVDTLRSNNIKVGKYIEIIDTNVTFYCYEGDSNPGYSILCQARCGVPQQLDQCPPDWRTCPLPHGHQQQEAGEEAGHHPVDQGNQMHMIIQ